MSPDETAGNAQDQTLGDPNADPSGLNDSTSEPDEELDETAAGADEEEDETSSDASDKPNIMFVGKEERTTIVDGEPHSEMVPRIPPTHIQNGMTKINLPSRETQQAGPFYHKDADTIVQLFPTFYKHVK